MMSEEDAMMAHRRGRRLLVRNESNARSITCMTHRAEIRSAASSAAALARLRQACATYGKAVSNGGSYLACQHGT